MQAVHGPRFTSVAPSRGRGLKHTKYLFETAWIGRPFTGAWIETQSVGDLQAINQVAPSRGRGLKLDK